MFKIMPKYKKNKKTNNYFFNFYSLIVVRFCFSANNILNNIAQLLLNIGF